MAQFFARFAIALVVALGISHAHAQAPESEPGRYTMSPADNGFVRLDRRTGEMAFCQRISGAWTCEAMDAGAPDGDRGMASNRANGADMAEPDVADELRALRLENRRLRDEIARLDERLGLGEPLPPPAVRPDGGPIAGLNLPSEAEVDRAIGYFGNILKKLKDQIEELRDKPATATPATPSSPPSEEKQL